METVNGNTQIISGDNTLVKIYNEVQRIPLDIFRWHHVTKSYADYEYLSLDELREQYEKTTYYKRSSIVQDGQLLTIIVMDASSGIIYQSGRGQKRKDWVVFGNTMGYL